MKQIRNALLGILGAIAVSIVLSPAEAGQPAAVLKLLDQASQAQQPLVEEARKRRRWRWRCHWRRRCWWSRGYRHCRRWRSCGWRRR
jgi:hypothetical protein